MKNVLLLVEASAAVFSVHSTARAESAGAYVQATAGHVDSDASNGSTYGVLGGYRWAVDAPFYLGVEGGYVNLGRSHLRSGSTISFTDATGPHTLSSQSRGRGKNEALLLGINAKWELPGQYYLTAHAGVARYRAQTRVRSTGVLDGVPTEGFSDRFRAYDTNYYAGIGFGYDFESVVSLGITYDHYAPRYESMGFKETVKFDTYGASLGFRF